MIFVLFRVYYYPNRQMCNKERKLVNEVLKLENLWSMGGGKRTKKKPKDTRTGNCRQRTIKFLFKRKKKKKKKRSGMER